MPKELTNLAKYSTRVAQALPDFLDQTVNHRLKQVAQKNSYRNLSQSIDPGRMRDMKNYYSRLSASKHGQ